MGSFIREKGLFKQLNLLPKDVKLLLSAIKLKKKFEIDKLEDTPVKKYKKAAIEAKYEPLIAKLESKVK